MIPNAPSIVGAGYNPITYPPGLKNQGGAAISGVLAALGECPEVPEKDLEAYAILAANGTDLFLVPMGGAGKPGHGFRPVERRRAQGPGGYGRQGPRKPTLSRACPQEVMDLVPVKPLKDDEEDIKSKYRLRLNPLYEKIKP
ncbi:MAG: hypothetical protein MZV63_65765 [Marinilabiliales bacterium]|nr:hypothetical protein [Marinilabiliales bacterium]